MGLPTTDNLWASAVGRLSEVDRAQITSDGQDQLESLSHLQKITTAAKDQCIKKRWRLPCRNGESIILRDLFSKIFAWVDIFMQIGDRVVQYEPSHAALPWACIRFILQVYCRLFVRTKSKLTSHETISSDINTFSFLVEEIERTCRMISRYAMFEEIYLCRTSSSTDELKEALTRLYASILLYLSKAKSFFEQKTACKLRWASNFRPKI